jgi:hypothetical protein
MARQLVTDELAQPPGEVVVDAAAEECAIASAANGADRRREGTLLGRGSHREFNRRRAHTHGVNRLHANVTQINSRMPHENDVAGRIRGKQVNDPHQS